METRIVNVPELPHLMQPQRQSPHSPWFSVVMGVPGESVGRGLFLIHPSHQNCQGTDAIYSSRLIRTLLLQRDLVRSLK